MFRLKSLIALSFVFVGIGGLAFYRWNQAQPNSVSIAEVMRIDEGNPEPDDVPPRQGIRLGYPIELGSNLGLSGSTARLSPDGRQAAFLASEFNETPVTPESRHTHLVIANTGDQRIVSTHSSHQIPWLRNAASLSWLNETQLLIVTSQETPSAPFSQGGNLILFDLLSTQVEEISKDVGSQDVIFSIRNNIAYLANPFDGPVYWLRGINITTGAFEFNQPWRPLDDRSPDLVRLSDWGIHHQSFGLMPDSNDIYFTIFDIKNLGMTDDGYSTGDWYHHFATINLKSMQLSVHNSLSNVVPQPVRFAKLPGNRFIVSTVDNELFLVEGETTSPLGRGNNGFTIMDVSEKGILVIGPVDWVPSHGRRFPQKQLRLHWIPLEL